MSTSTLSSPPASQPKPIGRRVSFNIGSSAVSPSAGKGRRSHQTSFSPGNADRRTRVDDAADNGNADDSGSGGDHHRMKSKNKGKSLGQFTAANGTLLPATTARAAALGTDASAPLFPLSTAAGLTNAVHTNVNPALGVNPVLTHANAFLPGYGQIPIGTSTLAQQGLGGFGVSGIGIGGSFMAQSIPGTMSGGGVPFAYVSGIPGVSGGLAAGSDPASTGVTFAPAVPDATNGPMLHTYVPRSDLPVAMSGPGGVGLVYVQPQPPTGYATTAQGIPMTTIPLAAGGIATTTAPMMPFVTQPQASYMQQQIPVASGTYGGQYGGGGGGGGGPPVMVMPGGLPQSQPLPMTGAFGEGTALGVQPEAAMGVGQTPNEVLQEQLEFAYTNNLNEPQDFKPADDDKSRYYWVRETDGNWTQRNRATIDHIGCRWYLTSNGIFYAVRLAN